MSGARHVSEDLWGIDAAASQDRRRAATIMALFVAAIIVIAIITAVAGCVSSSVDSSAKEAATRVEARRESATAKAKIEAETETKADVTKDGETFDAGLVRMGAEDFDGVCGRLSGVLARHAGPDGDVLVVSDSIGTFGEDCRIRDTKLLVDGASVDRMALEVQAVTGVRPLDSFVHADEIHKAQMAFDDATQMATGLREAAESGSGGDDAWSRVEDAENAQKDAAKELARYDDVVLTIIVEEDPTAAAMRVVAKQVAGDTNAFMSAMRFLVIPFVILVAVMVVMATPSLRRRLKIG